MLSVCLTAIKCRNMFIICTFHMIRTVYLNLVMLLEQYLSEWMDDYSLMVLVHSEII